MKIIKMSFFIGIILITGCNNPSKTFVYENLIEITLPPKFYIRNSQIYDKKNKKFGELPSRIYTPVKNISLSEYMDLYQNEGEIETKGGLSISFLGHEPGDIIKIDSIQLANYKWYYFVERTDVSNGSGKGWEIRNIYSFLTLENDKILSIWFLGKKIKKDESEYFISIVETVKIL